jgi:hypothetical protein
MQYTNNKYDLLQPTLVQQILLQIILITFSSLFIGGQLDDGSESSTINIEPSKAIVSRDIYSLQLTNCSIRDIDNRIEQKSFEAQVKL